MLLLLLLSCHAFVVVIVLSCCCCCYCLVMLLLLLLSCHAVVVVIVLCNSGAVLCGHGLVPEGVKPTRGRLHGGGWVDSPHVSSMQRYSDQLNLDC